MVTNSTLRIAAVGGSTHPGHIDLRFTHTPDQNSATLACPLPNPCVGEEIRWYLEEYVQFSPSEGERAADAKAALLQHTKLLAFYIDRSGVLPAHSPDEGKRILLVEVEDSPAMPPGFLWEALEREVDVPILATVKGILVTRVWDGDGALLPSSGNREVRDLIAAGEKFNVLIVSARPYFEADIDHRLVPAEALGSLQHVWDTVPLWKEIGFINIEVLHPATFDTLRSTLESHSPGYYSLLHLDLHGVEDESGR